MKNLIVLIVLLFSAFGFAQNEELFDKGNAAYQNGEYEAAINAYEAILDSEQASAEVYFNLGNAHYKLNHVAPSIYYYEKALQLDPNDQDIKNNIEFARNMAIDDIEDVKKTGISQWFNNLISNKSASGWAVLAVVFSVLFVIFFMLYYSFNKPVLKRVFLGIASLSVICCILSVVFAFQQDAYVQLNQYAVIYEEEVEVRDEPNLRGEASFELHEGTKAKILEDFQEWSKIELSNGAQGWVNSANIRKL